MSYLRHLTVVLTLIMGIQGWSQEEVSSELSLAVVNPISNPVFHESAFPQNSANLIYLYHRFPDKVNLQGGSTVPIDGEAHIYALQLELMLSESLSFVANKDGYVDLQADSTLADEEGFANLAFGLKWAPYLTETSAIALRGTVEVPTGNDKVFQGTGDGSFSPAILGTWNSDVLTLNGVGGVILPFDNNSESTISYMSLGTYAHVTDWLHPLVEVNWFHVLHAGDGGTQVDDEQGGALVSSAVSFDDGGFFNFGAAGASNSRDFVSGAIGLWVDLHDNVALGLAYELPLTDKENSLMDDRYNVNLRVTW